jgi:hypothetical protein
MTIDAGWAAVIVTVLVAAATMFGWLMPSPKDREKMAQTLREDAMRMWTERLTSLETDHRGLEREYIKSNAELRAAVQGLNSSVASLNVTIKELTATYRSA